MISYSSVGPFASGTGPLSSTSLTGAQGDAVIGFVGNKPYADTPTTPSGWTAQSTVTSGTTSSAVRMTSCFIEAPDASSVEFRPFFSFNTSVMGQVMRFSKPSASTWATEGIGAFDSTAARNAVDASTTAPAGWAKAGDLLAIGIAMDGGSTTHTDQSIVIAGCTINVNWLPINSTGGFTNQTSMQLGYAEVLSGSSTGAVEYTAYSTPNNISTVAFNLVRLREIPPPATIIKAGNSSWTGLLKTHNGSAWVPRIAKRHNGSSWVSM